FACGQIERPLLDLRPHRGVRPHQRVLSHLSASGRRNRNACTRNQSHFQSANWSRSAVFLNLPTLVRGIASTKTNASGTCHLAKDCRKKLRRSSGAAVAPSFSTTTASGRSCHFGCGTPTTQASLTAWCPIKAFSRSTELIHSPPDFTRSFARSTILTTPSGS